VYTPAEVKLVQTGQIRYQTEIVLNVKLDYMPQDLLQSASCNDRCSGILLTELVDGDTGALSIKSAYLPGSSYSFSIHIEFGRPYIGEFRVKVRVSPVVSQKYFKTVSTNQVLEVQVQPAYLSKVDSSQEDFL
jgi:hypothetical protein